MVQCCKSKTKGQKQKEGKKKKNPLNTKRSPAHTTVRLAQINQC